MSKATTKDSGGDPRDDRTTDRAGLRVVGDIEVKDIAFDRSAEDDDLAGHVRHLTIHRGLILASIVLDGVLVLVWAGIATLTNSVVHMLNAPVPVVIASYLGEFATLVVVVAYLFTDVVNAIAQALGVAKARRK